MQNQDTIFIRPAGQYPVRSPDHNGNDLPESGAYVANSTYWQRRLKDGDVELTQEASDEVKASKTKQPSSNEVLGPTKKEVEK